MTPIRLHLGVPQGAISVTPPPLSFSPHTLRLCAKTHWSVAST